MTKVDVLFLRENLYQYVKNKVNGKIVIHFFTIEEIDTIEHKSSRAHCFLSFSRLS